MKKIIAIILSLLCLVNLCGCGKNPQSTNEKVDTEEKSGQNENFDKTNGGAQMVNPMVSVDGTEDFSRIDVELYAPETAENCKYFIISGKIAQIDFTADGTEYTLRGANTDEDISGVYAKFEEEEGGVLMDHKNGSLDIGIRYTTEGGALAEWKLRETSYSLFAASVSDRDAFTKAATSCGDKLLANYDGGTEG